MLRKLCLLFACSAIEDAVEQDEIANSLVTTTEEEQHVSTPEEVEEPTDDVLGSAELTAEDDLDWLPTEQEKVFPDEVIERYAERRYPELLAQLVSPDTPERLRQQVRQILHDKLNSDIALSRQVEEDEPVEEVVVSQPRQLPTRQEWFDAIRQQVRAVQDPQLAREFFTAFNKIWGADAKKMLAANPKVADEFTELLSVVAINLIKTHVNNLVWQFLPAQLEATYPGFSQMYERSAHIMAWDRVRGNPAYRKLPAYGTREFATQARAAATRYFGSDTDFENAVFTKVVNGQRVALTPLENSEKKYAILARIMAGQNVDPGLIRQAVRTGARQQRRRQVTGQGGRLGAGTTRGERAPSGEDDLFTDGLRLYQQEHGKL